MTGGPAVGSELPSPMNPAEFANIARAERDFWWYRGMRAIVLGLVDPFLTGRKIVRVLEAGCGTGYFSHLLQQQRGWPVAPLDISWHGLLYARSMGVKHTVQGDITSLPFAAGVFDVVLSMDVLAHLAPGREQPAARELIRVVAPGGVVAVRTSALNALRSRHSAFIFERQRFTRRRLVDLFTAAGLRVRRCTYVNSLLLPMALIKFRIWEPLRRQPPASGIQPVSAWLDRVLHGALAAEARWLGSGHDLPLGQSLVLVGEKA